MVSSMSAAGTRETDPADSATGFIESVFVNSSRR